MPHPFPTEADLRAMAGELEEACRNPHPLQAWKVGVPAPKGYEMFIENGNVVDELAKFKAGLSRKTPACHAYLLGHFYRSCGEHLPDSQLLSSFRRLYFPSVSKATWDFTIRATNLLNEFPGLFLVPAFERFLENESATALKKLREMLETTPEGKRFACDAVREMIWPRWLTPPRSVKRLRQVSPLENRR